MFSIDPIVTNLEKLINLLTDIKEKNQILIKQQNEMIELLDTNYDN